MNGVRKTERKKIKKLGILLTYDVLPSVDGKNKVYSTAFVNNYRGDESTFPPEEWKILAKVHPS